MNKAAIKFNGIDPSEGRMFNVTCPFCKEENATISWDTNLLECEDCGKQANIYVYYAELGEVGGPQQEDENIVISDIHARINALENKIERLGVHIDEFNDSLRILNERWTKLENDYEKRLFDFQGRLTYLENFLEMYTKK
jgi:ribosomal protein S27E